MENADKSNDMSCICFCVFTTKNNGFTSVFLTSVDVAISLGIHFVLIVPSMPFPESLIRMFLATKEQLISLLHCQTCQFLLAIKNKLSLYEAVLSDSQPELVGKPVQERVRLI
jgi:hypothetical protein